jgi:hypothetical protein
MIHKLYSAMPQQHPNHVKLSLTYCDDKWHPMLGEHSGIISTLRRLFCRGEQLAKDENRVSILGENIWGFGDASAHYSAR